MFRKKLKEHFLISSSGEDIPIHNTKSTGHKKECNHNFEVTNLKLNSKNHLKQSKKHQSRIQSNS